MKNFVRKNDAATAAGNCIQVSACEAVQVNGRVECGIETLRARLKLYLDQPDLVVVRKFHRSCALLVPLKLPSCWQEGPRRKRIAALRRMVLAELKRLEESESCND